MQGPELHPWQYKENCRDGAGEQHTTYWIVVKFEQYVDLIMLSCIVKWILRKMCEFHHKFKMWGER